MTHSDDFLCEQVQSFIMLIHVGHWPQEDTSMKRSQSVIETLGLPRLDKRTKSAMLKRAKQIEAIVKRKRLSKAIRERALMRAEFYRQRAG